jgi:hypothetical protein
MLQPPQYPFPRLAEDVPYNSQSFPNICYHFTSHATFYSIRFVSIQTPIKLGPLFIRYR